MTDVIFHVGAPKTGSTFLQREVFPNMEDTLLVADAAPGAAEAVALLRRFTGGNPAFVDLALEKRRFDALRCGTSARRILVSFEELFGDFFFNFPNNFFIADCLAAVAPDARIILVVRRQPDWLESAYSQSLKAFQSRSIEDFLLYENGAFADPEPLDYRAHVSPRLLDWSRYAMNYARLFGRDNVLVLPYELMTADREAFLARMGAFIGTPLAAPERPGRRARNASLGRVSAVIARGLNRFVVNRYHGGGFIPDQPFHRYFAARRERSAVHRWMASLTGRMSLPYILENYVDRIFPIPARHIGADLRARILEMHRETNASMDREFGLGLDEHGYY